MEISPSDLSVHIASDHAGFSLKNFLVEHLRTRGYAVEDMGAYEFSPDDDYPDFVTPCAQKVAQENAREVSASRAFGIVIGGSGEGEAMAANRVQGVRAAVFYGGAHALGAIDEKGAVSQDELDIVRLTREHNDANILSLGARFISEELARKATILFLETRFSDVTRHVRRISKF